MKSLLLYLNIIVPRFITEYAACRILPNGQFEPICAVADLREDEVPDGVVLINMFNFFGIAVFPKVKGEVLTWEEYQSTIKEK